MLIYTVIDFVWLPLFRKSLQAYVVCKNKNHNWFAVYEKNLAGTDSEEDETTRSKDEEHIVSKRHLIIEEKCGHDSTPNRLSEELLQGLITIFLKLNQTERMTLGSSQYGGVPKLTLSCMSSKSFISKASIINCKASTFHSRLDPYGLFHDLDATSHVHATPYKKFVACTRSSLDMTQLSHSCLPEIERIRYISLI